MYALLLLVTFFPHPILIFFSSLVICSSPGRSLRHSIITIIIFVYIPLYRHVFLPSRDRLVLFQPFPSFPFSPRLSFITGRSPRHSLSSFVCIPVYPCVVLPPSLDHFVSLHFLPFHPFLFRLLFIPWSFALSQPQLPRMYSCLSLCIPSSQ